ncbi:MAG: OmpH family outer membrane protein [Deltaproteobacteria bacterium]|nr:OmpH family outer membrane protein [Deltaproteobacteria bacterium]
MKKLKISAILFLAVMLFSMPAAAATLKIGYANLQKALNECDAGEKAKETLQEEAQKLEEELNSKQESLKKMKEEIDKKSSVWNKETKEAKEQDFKVKSQEFQKQFMEYGEKLNKRKQEIEAEIIKGLRDTVEEIAKKKGYTYVFERSVGGLLYAPAEDDLTPEVIKAYNKSFKAGK